MVVIFRSLFSNACMLDADGQLDVLLNHLYIILHIDVLLHSLLLEYNSYSYYSDMISGITSL